MTKRDRQLARIEKMIEKTMLARCQIDPHDHDAMAQNHDEFKRLGAERVARMVELGMTDPPQVDSLIR